MRRLLKSGWPIPCILFLIVLTSMLVLSSCKGGTSSTTPDTPSRISESVSASVGSSGGAVSLRDGTVITFPANALSAATTITVTKTNAPLNAALLTEMQTSVNGLFYKFDPDGLIMNSKAAVTLSYGTLPNGYQPSDLSVSYYDGESWVEIPVESIDSTKGTLSFQTDHFTWYHLTYTGTHQYGTTGITVGNCNNYLNVDFKVTADQTGIDWLTYLSIGLYNNPHYETAYKIELQEQTSWGWYKTIRTITVYSVLYQDFYHTTGVELTTPFSGGLFGAFPAYRSNVLSALNLGTNQMRVMHYVEVFDSNGNRVSTPNDNDYFDTVADADDQAALNTLISDYYLHPTKSAYVLNAIPSSLLQSNTKYKLNIDITTAGSNASRQGHFESGAFTLADVNGCAGMTLPIPSLSITSPAQSYLYYTEDKVIAFTATAKDTLDNVITNIKWTDGNSCTNHQADMILAKENTFSQSLSVGTHFISATAVDSDGRSNTACRIVTVSGVTPAQPAINSSPPASVAVGSQFVYPVYYTADGTVTFSLSGAPAGMNIDTAHVVRWTPTNADIGQKTFSVKVTDQYGGQTTQQVSIDVLAQPNNEPQVNLLVVDSPTTVGQNVYLEADAYDNDGDPLTYTWSVSGGGSISDASDNSAWFAPSQIGTTTVTVKVSDGKCTVTKFGYITVMTTVPPDLATYTVSGTVTSGGVGLSGVTMTAPGAGLGTATTDSSGYYLLPGVANGTYTVTPSMTGYTFSPTSTSVTVNGANQAGNNFVATQMASYIIGGWVFANGNPLPGATVTLSGGSSSVQVTTDTNGYFNFFNVAAGTYTITAQMTGYVMSPSGISVTPNNSNADLNNVFTASPAPVTQTFSISGTIVDNNNAPLAGVALALSGTITGNTTTDANGNYSFTGLASGSYTIIPTLANYTFTPVSLSATVNGADVSGKNFSAIGQGSVLIHF
jgi:hypothetical protein